MAAPRPVRLLAALPLVLVTLVAPARAQAPPPAAPDAATGAASAQAPPRITEQVVVTGVADSAPVTVTTDPRLPRQPLPAHDGADYLDTIPGFSTVRKGGSGADPVLRGMAGSRLSVLIDDGALLGGCSNRMDAPTSYVFPEVFDRITIVKGPQTVKYGPTGSAGTVRFERTRDRFAGPTWLGAASMMGGSWGRNDEVADVRAGTAAFYVRASGSRSAMGDYDDGDGVAVHSEYLRWNAEGAVGWTPDAATLLEVSLVGSDGRAAYADRSVDGSKFARLGTSLRVERARPGRRIDRVEANAAYNSIDHVMDNFTLRPVGATTGMSGPSAMNPSRTTYGGRVAVRGLSSRLTWEAGLDAQANVHDARNTMRADLVPVTALPRVDDARFATAGAFLEASWQVTPRRLIVAGSRIDRAHGRDLRERVSVSMMQTMPNPTAQQARVDVLPGAFARVEQQVARAPVVAYAGLGHVRRMPDYWELIARESLGSVSAFGARPEATTQADLGLQWRGATTTAFAAVFTNRIDDFLLIEAGIPKPAGMGMGMGTRAATVTRNVDARTIGAEAGASRRLGALLADLSMAWVRGANTTDDRPLAQMPPLDARLSLAWDRPTWAAGTLVRAVAAQRRVAPGQGTIAGQDIAATPAFGVVSLNGSWKARRWATLHVGVDNVLGTTYAEHISRQGAAIPGYALQTRQVREPGRTWWVRLGLRH